jgi:hypothetical protein
MDHPGLYVEISAKEARVYSGAYGLEKEALYRLRTHIAQNLETFDQLRLDPDFVQKFGEIQGEKNKRLPKELQEAAAKQPLIYNKQFYYYAAFPAEVILTDEWFDTVIDHFITSRPMGEFILEGIGK